MSATAVIEKHFFDNNKGPYHCAYCGRRLKSNDLEVDHLIPVAKAKTSIGIRTWLHLCGITNVNDAKNLVGACERCNRAKSDKMGFWVMKGALGRHRVVWTIRNIVVTIVALVVAALVFNNFAAIKEAAMQIANIFI